MKLNLEHKKELDNLVENKSKMIKENHPILLDATWKVLWLINWVKSTETYGTTFMTRDENHKALSSPQTTHPLSGKQTNTKLMWHQKTVTEVLLHPIFAYSRCTITHYALYCIMGFDVWYFGLTSTTRLHSNLLKVQNFDLTLNHWQAGNMLCLFALCNSVIKFINYRKVNKNNIILMLKFE